MENLNVTVDLPVICTRGMLVFPGHELSLDVGRTFSLNAMDLSVSQHDSNIVLVSQIHPLEEEINFDMVYHHATLCKITKRIKKDNHGTIKLTVVGEKRVELESLYTEGECYYAKVRYLEDIHGDQNEEIALVRRITEQMQSMNGASQLLPRELISNITNGLSASELADTIGHYINSELVEREKILAEPDVNKRLLLVLACMQKEKAINEIENSINNRVKKSIDENQKEFYLR